MSPIIFAKPPIIISTGLRDELASTCIGRKLLIKRLNRLNDAQALDIGAIETDNKILPNSIWCLKKETKSDLETFVKTNYQSTGTTKIVIKSINRSIQS